MTATYEITAQYLTGNAPDGFNYVAWLNRLTAEYRQVVQAHQASGAIPNGPIDVRIDVQRASGVCRSAEVSITDNDTGAPLYHRALEWDIEAASDVLWESICDDPTLWHEVAP